MPDDDWRGVGRRDERHSRGRGIAAGHRDRVSRGDARGDAAAVRRLGVTSSRLHRRGGGRRRTAVIGLQQLRLQRTDVDHRVGVDSALRVASGGRWQGRGADGGEVTTVQGWRKTEDTEQLTN